MAFLVAAAMTLCPGDAPWGGDDRLLIRAAAACNAAHRLDDVGLTGSYGQPYGPVPVQIYQALLLVTHDLRTLVQLRAALFAGVTAAALFWLAKSIKITRWLVPAVMTGPYFWFYGRLLWDNTFAIPVGSLLLAGYASMCVRPGRCNALVTAACAAALPMIHLMNVPMVTAVIGHSLITRGREWVRRWKELTAVAIVTGVLCGSYIGLMFDRFVHPVPGTTAITPPADRPSAASAAVFPLLGARLFEGYCFFDERGPEIGVETGRLVTAARAVTLAVYPLVWLGIAVAAVRSRHGFSRGSGIVDAVSAVVVLTLLLQSTMDAATGLRPFPHYHGATWAVTAVCCWLGARTLWNLLLPHRAGPGIAVSVVAIATAAAAVCTCGFAVDIHRHAGGTRWHGPTMAAQGVWRVEDAR